MAIAQMLLRACGPEFGIRHRVEIARPEADILLVFAMQQQTLGKSIDPTYITVQSPGLARRRLAFQSMGLSRAGVTRAC